MLLIAVAVVICSAFLLWQLLGEDLADDAS
jgi:hypothetical protein